MTLLLMIITGAICYKVGSHYGYSRGETDMYHNCRRAEQARREVMPWLGM